MKIIFFEMKKRNLLVSVIRNGKRSADFIYYNVENAVDILNHLGGDLYIQGDKLKGEFPFSQLSNLKQRVGAIDNYSELLYDILKERKECSIGWFMLNKGE